MDSEFYIGIEMIESSITQLIKQLCCISVPSAHLTNNLLFRKMILELSNDNHIQK